MRLFGSLAWSSMIWRVRWRDNPEHREHAIVGFIGGNRRVPGPRPVGILIDVAGTTLVSMPAESKPKEPYCGFGAAVASGATTGAGAAATGGGDACMAHAASAVVVNARTKIQPFQVPPYDFPPWTSGLKRGQRQSTTGPPKPAKGTIKDAGPGAAGASGCATRSATPAPIPDSRIPPLQPPSTSPSAIGPARWWTQNSKRLISLKSARPRPG